MASRESGRSPSLHGSLLQVVHSLRTRQPQADTLTEAPCRVLNGGTPPYHDPEQPFCVTAGDLIAVCQLSGPPGEVQRPLWQCVCVCVWEVWSIRIFWGALTMTEFMRDCPNASPPMYGRMLSLSYCSAQQLELRAASLTKLEHP